MPILCGQCRVDEFDFDAARVFGIYRGNLRALILQLKFYRRERLGKRLGALLAAPWERIDFTGAEGRLLLVPVPLFRSRERERGFNQARLLAQGLACRLAKSPKGRKAQVAARVLVRTRSTQPQTGLKFSDRRDNVRHAFTVRDPERVKDRVVVLVDDVMTTGATLGACAKILKKAGASKVYAVALARATPQFPDTRGRADAGNIDELRREWT